MDLPQITATLTFASAAMQRFVEVLDGPIASATFLLLQKLNRAWRKDAPTVPATDISQVDPARIAQAKAKMIVLITFILGTAVCFGLHLDKLMSPDKTSNPIFNVLFGLMMSGGAEGTNSLIKYLQAMKDRKQQSAGINKTASTGAQD